MERGIWFIINLLDNRTHILTYTFMKKYKIVSTDGQYNTAIKAITQAMIQLIRGMLIYSVVIPQKPLLIIVACTFLR